jgi:hypothetical protein
MDQIECWAVMWQDGNGSDNYLVRWPGDSGVVVKLFKYRKLAKQWIDSEFGFIRKREDLRRPPHCWRMPKPVKVRITIVE